MKKVLLLLMAVGFAVLCGAALIPLDTMHTQLYVLRAEADEDTDLLDLTTEGNFANKPASAVQWKTVDGTSGHGGNGFELSFTGGSAAGKTFIYKFRGWRQGNGPARLVATGTVTLGSQAVVVYPQGSAATNRYWGHAITVTQTWNGNVRSSDTVGSNGIAVLVGDGSGFEWWDCEITSADGTTGTEAGDVTAYLSFW